VATGLKAFSPFWKRLSKGIAAPIGSLPLATFDGLKKVMWLGVNLDKALNHTIYHPRFKGFTMTKHRTGLTTVC
jgi:hypothetical protein